MKFILKSVLLSGSMLMAMHVSAQVNQHQSKTNSKETATMESTENRNKAVVRSLYDDILNKRDFDKLSSIISENYSNAQGGKGIEGFQKQIPGLIKAFPDAQWELVEVIAEGNKVFVKQIMRGTHKAEFQHIAATNRTVVNSGTGFYELENGKIVNNEIQTDRLGFLQQLGVIPMDLSTLATDKTNEVYFIDKFLLPEASLPEFSRQIAHNRNFIKSLEGFCGDHIYEQKDDKGNITLMTVATWKNKEYLNLAKAKVQAEYKRINFNPEAFYTRLHVQMERGVYNFHKE